MARKQTSSKTAKKAVMSSGAAAILTENFYGPEPKFDGTPLTRRQVEEALTWYNYNYSDKDSFKNLQQYMKASGMNDVNINSNSVLPSAGNLAKIVLAGGELPETFKKSLASQIEDGIKRSNRIKAEDSYVPVKTKRLNEENVKILNGIEDALMKLDTKFDAIEWFAKWNVDETLAKKIQVHYDQELKDLSGELDEDDTQFRDLLSKILEDIGLYLKSDTKLEEGKVVVTEKVKKPRKPRAKKVIPPEKKVAKVQYALEHKELGLKSIHPKEIIGKSALWYYDFKYGKLTVVRTDDPNGLDVKGTTVIYKDELSESKRIGRKARELTQEVLLGTKPALRKLLSGIKTTPVAVTGRLSENTILLKVEK